MNTPTREQIRAAIAARLAAVDGSKASLAEALRACCCDLPIDFPLTVGGHVIRAIDAECNVYGGRSTRYSRLHEKDVLLLDGRVVDEPRLEATYPDPDEENSSCVFYGPEDGWYEAGAWDHYRYLYEKLSDGPPQAFDSLKKPCRFALCELRALREVAADLADVMSDLTFRWLAEGFIYFDDEVVEEKAAALRPNDSGTQNL